MRPTNTHGVIATICIPTLLAPKANRAEDLGKQLSNPVTSLISVPFQPTRDGGHGSEDRSQTTLNVQPVPPFALTEDINLITRITLPHKWQDNISADPALNVGEKGGGITGIVLSQPANWTIGDAHPPGAVDLRSSPV